MRGLTDWHNNLLWQWHTNYYHDLTNVWIWKAILYVYYDTYIKINLDAIKQKVFFFLGNYCTKNKYDIRKNGKLNETKINKICGTILRKITALLRQC